MSQSEAHRRLVVDTAFAIQQRYQGLQVTMDVTEFPGDPVPPIINGYRPDIIGNNTDAGSQMIIAEAKTDGDLNRPHTLCQIEAFLRYLKSSNFSNGTFILAVSGRVFEKARTVLVLNYREWLSGDIHIELFDGVDFWVLGPPGETTWRLS